VRQQGNPRVGDTIGTGGTDDDLLADPMDRAEARYGMLEAIREYALEKLAASGEANAVHERHARYFLGLAQEARPQLSKLNQRWWIAKLDLESDNLRAALAWSLETSRANGLEVGLAFGETLWDFWSRQGYVDEGTEWLQRLLVRVDPRLSSDNTDTGSDESLVESLVLHRLAARTLQVLNGAAWLAIRARDMTTTRRYLDIALSLARRMTDKVAEATVLNSLGNLYSTLGDYGKALSYLESSLEIKRAVEGWDELNFAGTLTMYAWALAGTGEFARALVCEEESFMIKRRIGDTEGIGRSLFSLAEITWRMGDLSACGDYGEKLLELARNLGNKEGEAFAMRTLGDVARAQGHPEAALAYFTGALSLFQDLQQQNGALDCIAGLAQVAADQGQHYRAGVLAGAQVAAYTAIDAPQLALDTGSGTVFARLREQAAEGSWDRAWAEGQSMTMPQVIEYALDR
jgi:tetratricopeptide (TPR) repeat protein